MAFVDFWENLLNTAKTALKVEVTSMPVNVDLDLEASDLVGSFTDEPLAGEIVEGATARSPISLLKRLVNKLIEIKALLAATLTVTVTPFTTISSGEVQGNTAATSGLFVGGSMRTRAFLAADVADAGHVASER